MLTRIGAHLRANVIGYVALFIALSAGAYAAGLPRNSVKSKQIKDGQVKTADIGDGQVGAVDLAAGAVGSDKLADGAVGSAQIASGGVGSSDLGPNSVGSGNVVDGSLAGSDVGANALGGAQIDESSLSGVADSGVVASGTTLRGLFATRCCDDSFGVALTFDPISFGFTLPSAPTPHYIKEGDTAPAACPGTAAAPGADPGHLCVFETDTLNAGTERSVTDTSAQVRSNGDTAPFGFVVYSTVTSETRATVEGSWAVTAP